MLVSATGTYTGADNKTASYTLAMGYDNMHRITSKRQILTQNNVQFNGTLNVGYDLSYTYGTETGKKFQLANVKDVNYRTEETPSESENVNNNHAYEYDANGNLVMSTQAVPRRMAWLTIRPRNANSNGMRRTVFLLLMTMAL